MIFIKDVILKETIRFIELCQVYVSTGKLPLNEYYPLTNTKLNFIQSILSDEEKQLLAPELDLRLRKLFSKNTEIYDLCIK